MKIQILQLVPRPVLIVTCPAALGARKEAAEQVFNKLLELGVVAVTCRGVGLDRLGVILDNGCDVSPTDSPIFADSIDKAIEYGGPSQVLQIFDIEKLNLSFTEVSVHADPNRIQELKNTYKSWETSLNREKIWFSMLPLEDRRLTKPNEAAFGWYIPGNAWDALIALAIFVETHQQRDHALGLLQGWIDQPEPR
jgi:hypothetical protein